MLFFSLTSPYTHLSLTHTSYFSIYNCRRCMLASSRWRNSYIDNTQWWNNKDFKNLLGQSVNVYERLTTKALYYMHSQYWATATSASSFLTLPNVRTSLTHTPYLQLLFMLSLSWPYRTHTSLTHTSYLQLSYMLILSWSYRTRTSLSHTSYQEYIRTRVCNTTHWGLARRNFK